MHSSKPGKHILADKTPHAQGVEFSDDALVVHLKDGRSLMVPLEWFPRLRDATSAERNNWRLIGRGIGIHWEALDEDISVRGLLIPEETYDEAV
jgi:hypothetical protein